MNQNQRNPNQRPNFRRQQRRGYHQQQSDYNSNNRNQYRSRINPLYTAKTLRSWKVRKPIKLFKEYQRNNDANPNAAQMRIIGDKPNLTIYDPQSKIDEMEPIQKKWSSIVKNNNRGNIKTNARIIIDHIDPACFDNLYQQHRFWRRFQNSFVFNNVDDISDDGDHIMEVKEDTVVTAKEVQQNDNQNGNENENGIAKDMENGNANMIHLEKPKETTEKKHLLFNIERKDYFYYELDKPTKTISIIMKEDSKILQTHLWQEKIRSNWQPTKDTFGLDAALKSSKPIKNYDILINNVPRMGYDDESGNCLEGIRDLLSEEFGIKRKDILRAYRWRSGIKDIYRNNERKVQVTLDGTVATPKTKTVGPIKIEIQEFDATKVKPDAFKKIRQCWVCKDIKCPRGKCPLFLKLKKQAINEINFNQDIIHKQPAIKQIRIVGRCNNCATVGHDASNCNNYRFCILCGSTEHGSRKNRKCVVIQQLMKLLSGEIEENQNEDVHESEDMENELEFGNNESKTDKHEMNSIMGEDEMQDSEMQDSRLLHNNEFDQTNQSSNHNENENNQKQSYTNYNGKDNQIMQQYQQQSRGSQYGPTRSVGSDTRHRGGANFYDNSQRGNYSKAKSNRGNRFAPYQSGHRGRGRGGRGRGSQQPIRAQQPPQNQNQNNAQNQNSTQQTSQNKNQNQNQNQNSPRKQQANQSTVSTKTKTNDEKAREILAQREKEKEKTKANFASMHQTSTVAEQARQYEKKKQDTLLSDLISQQTQQLNSKNNAMHIETGMSQQPELRDQMQ